VGSRPLPCPGDRRGTRRPPHLPSIPTTSRHRVGRQVGRRVDGVPKKRPLSFYPWRGTRTSTFTTVQQATPSSPLCHSARRRPQPPRLGRVTPRPDGRRATARFAAASSPSCGSARRPQPPPPHPAAVQRLPLAAPRPRDPRSKASEATAAGCAERDRGDWPGDWRARVYISPATS
jgi:hypothetical protein